MSIKINEELEKINTSLGSVGTGSLSSLGSENQSLLGILSSRVGGVINSAGADKWDCKIKDEIQSFVSGTVTESINKAIKSSQFVSDSVGHVENLKTICNQYVTEFGKYETELKKTGIKRYEDEENTKETKEYRNWRYTINAYENSLPKLEDEALRVKQEVANYFASVDFTTNTSDSKIFSMGATDIKIDYEEYFNGELKAIKEEYEVKKEEIKTDTTTGDVTYEQEYTVEKEFADGTKVKGEGTETLEVKNSTGKASNEVKNATSIISKKNKDAEIENLDEEEETIDLDADKKVKQLNDVISEEFVHKVHEEGTIESIDAKTQDYVYDKEDDNAGIIHEKTTVKDSETKEVIYDKDKNREYHDEDNGYDCIEMSTEETQGNEKTYTWNTSYYLDDDYDEVQKESSYTLTVGTNGTGTFIRDDGNKTVYYRGDDDKLYEKSSWGDRVVDESVTKKFKLTKNGETVVELDVNPNSALDQARMRYEIDKARSEHGTGVSSMESSEEIVQRMSNQALGYSSDFYSNGIRDGQETYEWNLE